MKITTFVLATCGIFLAGCSESETMPDRILSDSEIFDGMAIIVDVVIDNEIQYLSGGSGRVDMSLITFTVANYTNSFMENLECVASGYKWAENGPGLAVMFSRNDAAIQPPGNVGVGQSVDFRFSFRRDNSQFFYVGTIYIAAVSFDCTYNNIGNGEVLTFTGESN